MVLVAVLERVGEEQNIGPSENRVAGVAAVVVDQHPGLGLRHQHFHRHRSPGEYAFMQVGIDLVSPINRLS